MKRIDVVPVDIRQEHEAWETEMDLLLEIRRRQMKLREDQKYNELMASLRWLILLGCVCASWYFRNV